MIVQQVNLYTDRFKEKIVPLSARHLLVILIVTIAVLAYSSYWYADRLSFARLQQQQLESEKARLGNQLTGIKARLEALLANNQYDTQITRLTRDVTVRKHMISFVENNQFGSGKGFSTNLEGLSRFNVKDVWLNEIKLSDNYIRIAGSSLSEENVPQYFSEFKRQQLFKGRQFDIFEMVRPTERDWKVDFVIASRAADNE